MPEPISTPMPEPTPTPMPEPTSTPKPEPTSTPLPAYFYTITYSNACQNLTPEQGALMKISIISGFKFVDNEISM